MSNLSDNEIIKALKCCSCNKCTTDGCPLAGNRICMTLLTTYALDLINRLKEENERLTEENKILSLNADTAFQDGLNEAQELYADQIRNEVKSEAYKEFAERLKDNTSEIVIGGAYKYKVITVQGIDNLLKEMG